MAKTDAKKQPKSLARNSAPLRLGICGLGRAGMGMIFPEVKGLADFRITGGHDELPERAERLSRECGARAHHSYEAFLADENIDVVVIATRSHQHAQMTLQALRAGKDVIVEKPMAMTVKDADRMIATARRLGRRLLVRHNRRFDPPLLQAKEVIRSGRLGKIFQVQLRQVGYQQRADWQAIKRFGGGQLLNWGPHLVDWSMQLIGAPAASVWADLKKIAARGDAEDHVKILIRGTNGVVADMEISGAAALPQPGWTILGSLGTLVIDDNRCRVRSVDPKSLAKIKADPKTPPQDASFGGQTPMVWTEETFDVNPKDQPNFWIEVHNTLRRGKKFPVTLEEARENIRVIELARKAADVKRKA